MDDNARPHTTKPLLSLHRKEQLAGCSLGYRLYFCVFKPSSGRRLHEAETGSRLTNGSCTMSVNSNHDAKRDRRCRSANSGRLMTLLSLSLPDFRRFLTVLVDSLLGSQCCLSTGLVANGIRLTTRCNATSSRTDVTRGLTDLGKSFTKKMCSHRCDYYV
jgi:hypothetical protein